MASLLPDDVLMSGEGGAMQTRFPIHELLRGAHVDYAVMPNRSAFTAQDESPDLHRAELGSGRHVCRRRRAR